MILMVFDVETNGYAGSSVVQFSAVKYKYIDNKIKKIDSINTYYVPVESFNMKAYEIHNLSLEFLKQKVKERYNELKDIYREEIKDEEFKNLLQSSIKYFKNDIVIEEFISDVDIFIGHNIERFDMKFLKEHIEGCGLKEYYIFDTMIQNTPHMKMPPPEDKKVRYKYKSPKLQETAEFYGIKVDETKTHDARYDVTLTVKILKEMMKIDKFKKILLDM